MAPAQARTQKLEALPLTAALSSSGGRAQDETYFLGQDLDCSRPVNARNEAAALSWMLDHKHVVCRSSPEAESELAALCSSYCTRLGDEPPEAPDSTAASSGRPYPEDSPETALYRRVPAARLFIQAGVCMRNSSQHKARHLKCAGGASRTA